MKSKNKIINYYYENKEMIERIIKHGEPLARCNAKGLKRYVEEKEKNGE